MIRALVLNSVKKIYYEASLVNIRTTHSTKSSDGNETNPDLIPMIDYDDPIELPLPVYPTKENESLDTRKSRLLYQSRKRGMLENDLLMSSFASKYLKTFNEEQTALYDELINKPTNDWEIYYWAIGVKPTPSEYDNEVMNLFKKHVSNPNRESRLRQPEL